MKVLKEELKKIVEKEPMDMTKEDIAKLVKAVQKKYPINPSNPSHEANPFEVAEGLLCVKKNDPEIFVEIIKIESALALGEYTPGEGIFKKKYADPFPKR